MKFNDVDLNVGDLVILRVEGIERKNIRGAILCVKSSRITVLISRKCIEMYRDCDVRKIEFVLPASIAVPQGSYRSHLAFGQYVTALGRDGIIRHGRAIAAVGGVVAIRPRGNKLFFENSIRVHPVRTKRKRTPKDHNEAI